MSSEEISFDSNLQYWADRWTQEKIGFHQKVVDKFLLKYLEQVTGHSLPSKQLAKDDASFKENSSKTWFVPLCGKTLDIPFLLSLGYKVFAVEGVRQAIENLGSENGLELEWDATNSLFVGADGRLKIYIGDLFECPIEQFGPFDYVWDRGSLIALPYPLRDTYKKAMQRALKSCNFVYLLEAVRYDKTKFGGPPRSLYEEDVDTLYRDWTTVKLLEKVPLPETHSTRIKSGIEDLDELIYLITPKD